MRGGLFDDVDLPRMQVSPLADVPAQTLLDQTFPDLAGRVRRRILDDARGNPLALLELPVVIGTLRHAEPRRRRHSVQTPQSDGGVI